MLSIMQCKDFITAFFFFNKIRETSAAKLFPITLPTTDPLPQDNVGLNFVFPKNEKQKTPSPRYNILKIISAFVWIL